MNGKTVPISVRFEQDEAEFLATLSIDGAKTLSEKLRRLVQNERQKREKAITYQEALKETYESLSSQLRFVKEEDLKNGMHSEIFSKAFEIVPEIMAYLKFALSSATDSKIDLLDVERKLTDKIFLMIESTLQLGVTSECNCYDKKLINNKLSSIKSLLDALGEVNRREG